MLKQSDSWKKLFGDLDSLSVAEIDKLVADDINSFIDDTMDFDLNEKDDKRCV